MWSINSERAIALLSAAYAAEVKFRHHALVKSDGLTSNINQVADFLISDNAKFGLMLCGMCGNGKTTMLYAIQQATNYLRDHDYFKNSPIAGTDIGLPIKDARELTQLRTDDYKTFIATRNRPLLAIDDLGIEPTETLDYGNVLSPVVDILEHRYTYQLFTIVTTNLTPQEIGAKYGVRIADRFAEMMEKVIFENPTYR